jgi:hypothetical protein
VSTRASVVRKLLEECRLALAMGNLNLLVIGDRETARHLPQLLADSIRGEIDSVMVPLAGSQETVADCLVAAIRETRRRQRGLEEEAAASNEDAAVPPTKKRQRVALMVPDALSVPTSAIRSLHEIATHLGSHRLVLFVDRDSTTFLDPAEELEARLGIGLLKVEIETPTLQLQATPDAAPPPPAPEASPRLETSPANSESSKSAKAASARNEKAARGKADKAEKPAKAAAKPAPPAPPAQVAQAAKAARAARAAGAARVAELARAAEAKAAEAEEAAQVARAAEAEAAEAAKAARAAEAKAAELARAERAEAAEKVAAKGDRSTDAVTPAEAGGDESPALPRFAAPVAVAAARGPEPAAMHRTSRQLRAWRWTALAAVAAAASLAAPGIVRHAGTMSAHVGEAEVVPLAAPPATGPAASASALPAAEVEVAPSSPVQPPAPPPASLPEPVLAAPSAPASVALQPKAAVARVIPEAKAPAKPPAKAATRADAKPAASAPTPLLVNFNAAPWAEIEVDGREFGPTPVGNVRLTAGSHRVVARFPDGRVLERKIQVDERRTRFEIR